MWFRRARERKAAWRRFSELADRVGARDGQVVLERRSGDMFQAVSYSVITFRRGSADEVARAQIEGVMAAGYTVPKDPPCTMPLPCGFNPEGELPLLYLETVPEGTAIRGRDTVIPAGHTGVIITIG